MLREMLARASAYAIATAELKRVPVPKRSSAVPRVRA